MLIHYLKYQYGKYIKVRKVVNCCYSVFYMVLQQQLLPTKLPIELHSFVTVG